MGPISGSKQSAEHIAKRIAARRRNGTYAVAPETRAKIANTLTGVPFTQERRDALSKMRTGKPQPWKRGKPVCQDLASRIKRGRARAGEKCNLWRGGVRSANLAVRDSIHYKEWRKAVFARDDWTCLGCGNRGGKLQAHHVKPFSTHPELRFEASNGQTLCIPCHKKTDSYGVNPPNKRPATVAV
jgi:5-methylcytosine-specific restriction endonuclease McrA